MEFLPLISAIISTIAIIFTILAFAFTRKDKAKDETSKEQYKMGVLEEKIEGIAKQIDKILDKLDGYDGIIEQKIEKAVQQHIKEYHKEK